MTDTKELVELARAMNREKAKVFAWRMQNPLSTDGRAPAWPLYKAARDAFNDAVSEIS